MKNPALKNPLLAFCALCALPAALHAAEPAAPLDSVDALLYSTMPSSAAHRPEMALDGDENSYFKSFYDMKDGDDFQILLARPVPLRSLKIVTGDSEKQDLLTSGFVEISADGQTYRSAATFNEAGVAEAALNDAPVTALRIRLNPRRRAAALLIREITLDSPVKLGQVQLGPGRGFMDLSQAPDLAAWAARAQKQMQEFWPAASALLYSHNFLPPNKINVVFRTGPGVTPVAAYGGGVMTVNSKWCREQPNDTALTVHEMAHAVQAIPAYNPVWLIEGIADYVRWVKFEPQNHKPRLDPAKASYRDAHRTTATFLAWCELRYDSALVTKLNHAVRFGKYNDALFKQLCGKDVDTLWAEFIAAYKADPAGIITPPVPAADKPRTLPNVAAGAATPVDLKAHFNAAGTARDGAKFSGDGGFDSGGASYSAALLGATLTAKNVNFTIGEGDKNLLVCRGQKLDLPTGNFASLWLLGAAIGGSQLGQNFTVTYTDGSTQTLSQNFSDWYDPKNFPGEFRALRTDYRNMADGARDARAFNLYGYGFALDPAKTVKSLTLPDNIYLRFFAASVAK